MGLCTSMQHFKFQKTGTSREMGLCTSMQHFKFQKTDPSLAGMEAVPGYFQRDGVMYFLQNTDPSLTGMEAVPGYFQRDGVMYRRWVPKGRPEDAAVKQIVFPKACHKTVLHLAHTVPLGRTPGA